MTTSLNESFRNVINISGQIAELSVNNLNVCNNIVSDEVTLSADVPRNLTIKGDLTVTGQSTLNNLSCKVVDPTNEIVIDSEELNICNNATDTLGFYGTAPIARVPVIAQLAGTASDADCGNKIVELIDALVRYGLISTSGP